MVVTELEFLEAWIPEQMAPGTVFVLDGEGRFGSEEKPYFAVLACPRCGCMGLIKRSQYFGLEPMICGGDNCSAEYFVDEDNRIAFRRSQ